MLALALCAGASAQQIIDYSTDAKVKTLRVGMMECTAWDKPTYMQVACCDDMCTGNYSGELVVNTRYSKDYDMSGDIFAPGVGYINWHFSPGVFPGNVAFDISVGPDPNTAAAAEESGVFP